jgi:hypothetical protein
MFTARFASPINICILKVLYRTNLPRYKLLVFFAFSFIKNLNLLRKMSSPCCADPGAKQNHSAHGCEEQIGGVNTYKTGQGKSSIVIFTDIFGYSFINIRKVADQFAQGSQTTVLIPDLFNGDAMSPDLPNIWDLLPGWLKKHSPTDACNIADKFISTIKGHYQSIQVNNNYLFIYYFILFI